MRHGLFVLGISLSLGVVAQGHDIITTRITWNREISRLVYLRCASCHHEGGKAFSLTTYNDARPWAVAIKEETLARRMPPWGAVKGFGDFRNDQALSSEQLEIIVSWVDGGVPEGEDKDLPASPKFSQDAPVAHSPGEITVSGDYTLPRAFTLDGLFPQAPDDASFRITAQLPDGAIEPLLWLSEYKTKFAHPFLLRMPLQLPQGTVIRGVPKDAKVVLLPAAAPANTAAITPSPAHQSGPY
jgi:hypothetical protein